MPAEQKVGIGDTTTGRQVRVLEVTTLINGVPTVVEMQVLSISDSNGNILDMASKMDQLIGVTAEILNTLQALTDALSSAANLDIDRDKFDHPRAA